MSNIRLSALCIVTAFCLTIFAGSLQKIYKDYWAPKENVYIYLVKLSQVPDFGGYSKDGASPTWIRVKSCFSWWNDGWGFNTLLKENNAMFEDLYPDINEGELGRWIIITSKSDIVDDLKYDYRDVEAVEDGSLIFRIVNLDDECTLTSEEVKNDKTWGIRTPKVAEALRVLKPTRTVLIGVVDTGCDNKHPALKNSLVAGYNFAGGNVNDTSNRTANEMHATHVSGTIVAKPDSDSFYGIAHSVAKVMPVRVLNENGMGTVIHVSKGVVYAADHGVNVINMSLGAPQYSRALHDAVKYAVNKKGVTVVCAKGNSNTDRAFYPAEFPEVIRVTAVSLKEDGTEQRAYFSNYGPSSTCAAPGHFTYSTLPGGKYGFASGTSMACPHAAACAAVILSQDNLTPEQVKEIIKNRGDTLKTDKPVGKRINLLKFVQKDR